MFRRKLLSFIILFSVLLSISATSDSPTQTAFNLVFNKIQSAEIGFYKDSGRTQEISSIDFKLSKEDDERLTHKTEPFYIGWNISGPGKYLLTVYSTADYTNEIGKTDGYSLTTIDEDGNNHKMNLLLSDISGKTDNRQFKIASLTGFDEDTDWTGAAIPADKRTYSLSIDGTDATQSTASNEVELTVMTNKDVEAFMAGPFVGYLLLVLSNSN